MEQKLAQNWLVECDLRTYETLLNGPTVASLLTEGT